MMGSTWQIERLRWDVKNTFTPPGFISGGNTNIKSRHRDLLFAHFLYSSCLTSGARGFLQDLFHCPCQGVGLYWF